MYHMYNVIPVKGPLRHAPKAKLLSGTRTKSIELEMTPARLRSLPRDRWHISEMKPTCLTLEARLSRLGLGAVVVRRDALSSDTRTEYSTRAVYACVALSLTGACRVSARCARWGTCSAEISCTVVCISEPGL